MIEQFVYSSFDSDSAFDSSCTVTDDDTVSSCVVALTVPLQFIFSGSDSGSDSSSTVSVCSEQLMFVSHHDD